MDRAASPTAQQPWRWGRRHGCDAQNQIFPMQMCITTTPARLARATTELQLGVKSAKKPKNGGPKMQFEAELWGPKFPCEEGGASIQGGRGGGKIDFLVHTHTHTYMEARDVGVEIENVQKVDRGRTNQHGRPVCGGNARKGNGKAKPPPNLQHSKFPKNHFIAFLLMGKQCPQPCHCQYTIFTCICMCI